MLCFYRSLLILYFVFYLNFAFLLLPILGILNLMMMMMMMMMMTLMTMTMTMMILDKGELPERARSIAAGHPRVGHGSGPSMGRVGSQNSPSWVGRVGSGPLSKISNKIQFTRKKLIIRRL